MRERSTVALLTGGGDRPYALGMAAALVTMGLTIDFIGSDELVAPEVCDTPSVRFLNLRGDQRSERPFLKKAFGLTAYYIRLVRYSIRSEAPIFHVLWNARIEWFERTALTLFYRILGKRVVLTIHNVNREARDGSDGRFNRLTLRIHYFLANHLFVHTSKMKAELEQHYGVPSRKISVIPFGLNTTVADTSLTGGEARRQLGLSPVDYVVLFFGNIAPYKGLQHLVDAVALVARSDRSCRLVIAGRPKPEAHWTSIRERVTALDLDAQVVERIEYVPDDETEVYFKAADVLALPYEHVFQSGVLSLAYSFGLPAIVTDVGSLREDVIESVTGSVCPPRDPSALAAAIERHVSRRDWWRARRDDIRRLGRERYSWDVVGRRTADVYAQLTSGSEATKQRTDSHLGPFGTSTPKGDPRPPASRA